MSNSTTTSGPTSASGPTSSSFSITSTSSSTRETTSQFTTTTPPSTSSFSPHPSIFTVISANAQTTFIVQETTVVNADPSSTGAAPATSSSRGTGALQNHDNNSGGSSAQVKTVVPAVVVPVVAVALLVLGGIFFFRRKRANKEAELRRKEVEEYGFNPNADTGLGGAGAAPSVVRTATNDNVAAMSEADGSGYRGWGTTASARKASTTLGSASAAGAGAIGLARSDSGGYAAAGGHSPNGAHVSASYSDHNSADPLVDGGSRPISHDYEGVAALGTAPTVSNRNNGGVHRGPSNASSAYSNGQRSDTSGEGIHAIGSPTWGNEYLQEDGPYGPAGGAAPVIRDVSARRNTRIEQPSVMPQHARGGISQNF